MKFRINLFILLFVLSFGLTSSVYKMEDGYTIYWKEGFKLKWSDFKGPPDKSLSMTAMTNSGIGMKSEYVNDKLSFNVYCYFDEKKSWTKDRKDTFLLKHEQLHFDISELYTRTLRQKISLVQGDDKTIISKASKISDQVMKDWGNEQNRYDKETQHGIIVAKQLLWIEDIKNRLAVLDKFKSK